MRSAREVIPAGDWLAAPVDHIVLSSEDRHRRRVVLTGQRGTRFLLDLRTATALKNGDGLVLDDGSIVRVSGSVEPLVEIAARTALDFVRLAWHLGNRHADVQILDHTLRIRRDHVLENMVIGLGGEVSYTNTAFEPEICAPHGHHHEAAESPHGTPPDVSSWGGRDRRGA